MRVGKIGLLVVLLVHAGEGMCQKFMSLKPKQPIVCYAKPIDQHTSISAPKDFSRRSSTRSKPLFEVTYTGFTPQAQAAFQTAVDIWSNLLTSSQTIHVQAVWQPLDPGVLGSAIWGGVYANFPGAQNVNTYYPVALAEKMAGLDLNDSTEADIYANFSSAIDWDYGLTGNPASKKYDLVTVVLHELGHGLGFVDSYTVDSSNGIAGLKGTGIPLIYDLMLENNSGSNLYHDFTSPSAMLKTQLTSNAIFYNSQQVLANNAGNRAKIYAPSPFAGGSSISHVDESTYPAGNINSLMTPQIGTMESIHDPGPIVKAAFSDLGWIYTFIKHRKLPNTENVTGPSYTVKATITSDANPVSQINLFYSSGSATDTKVAMTPTGNVNEYSAQIPSTGTVGAYRYYIAAMDNLARKFTNPGKLILPGKSVQQYYNVFITGPDTTPPSITHRPKTSILNTYTSLKIDAFITDNIGIGQATLEYKINDVDQPSLTFISGIPDSLYSATINFNSSLNIGDKLKYRIVAIDNSSNHNSKTSPGTGYYEVAITGLKPTQILYGNNFNYPSDDFFGEDFSITTLAGFANGAIHSEHPYLEGSGFPHSERNIQYELLVPIKVKSHDATVKFNEVVLVEPGNPGTKFGDVNFFDYVIVEGSKDRGVTWVPVADGYNSRDNNAWLTRFNSSFSGNNSTGVGDSSLYRSRQLDLLKNFHAGDEVIIRFRLFSDASTAGWGWAIDDLKIQIDETPPTVLSNHQDYLLPGTTISPITIKATDSGGLKELSIDYRLNSQPLQNHEFEVVQNVEEYVLNLDVSGLSPGDTINYQILAKDSSSNQGRFPPVGYISTYILKPGVAVNQYVNNFNSFSNDFTGNFFSITNPAGFSDASINSDHFYYNGIGLDHTSSYSFLLMKPVIIGADNPYMQYDEVVIVEGHNTNIPFGNSAFNDYVVVEGSIDGGRTWKALIDGYDANDQSSWSNAFTNGTNGSSSLYKQRTINLLKKSGFKAGDTALIRFRLFANESLNGWGWSIDNLSIQGPVTAIESTSQDAKLHIYPNPAYEKITIQADAESAPYVRISLMNIQGSVLFSSDFIPSENVFIKEINLQETPPGLYLLKVETQDLVYTKKFVKQ